MRRSTPTSEISCANRAVNTRGRKDRPAALWAITIRTLPARSSIRTISGSMATNITELIRAAGKGDESAKAELFTALYDDLHAQASRMMRQQHASHTLQPTALVHEAFLRLARGNGASWADRQHFLALAAKAMRCVVVDHARGKGRKKRGGDAHAVPLSSLTLAFEDRVVDLIALDDALGKLGEHDQRAARVVELRFFGGLSNTETAAILDVSARTAERDWEVARAWLFRELSK